MNSLALWSRKRIPTTWKQILIISICGFLYIVLSMPDAWTLFHKHFSPPVKFQVLTLVEMEEMEKEHRLSSKFIINTTGCKIPRTPLIPAFYKNIWYGEIIPDCSYETNLSDLSEDGILTLRQKYANSDCCLHDISKVENQDNQFIMSTCKKFTNSRALNVSKSEILLTKCGRSMNFEANFVISPTVQEKISHWSQVSRRTHPPSVILIGVDTMSRSHAFRSLPKTMALMKEMGFVDFKGYHSTDSSTLHNMMGFLMGLTAREVRSRGAEPGCAPDWTSPFDRCPFIWKEFDLEKYITMYVEDGSGTFNWGLQSGFKNRPTDFYIHALFKSIKELRAKYSLTWGNKNRIDCTSNETVPQFVARYTEQFIKKFQNVPTFSLTWFNNPFHGEPFTLPQLDKEFLRIYQSINSSTQLLENTVLIFLSDHGDRFSPFSRSTIEAPIERGLPPLMIRIPKSISLNFPNLDESLKINTESLIGAIDVHHTLKHILSLTAGTHLNLTSKFKPALLDRSSLFYPVSSNRTCEQIHISISSCVCGLYLDTSPVNPLHLKKILEFAQLTLNDKVSNSKYRAVCHPWKMTVEQIRFARTLDAKDEYSDNLIQFEAYPGNAIFEVRVRIWHSGTETEFDSFELIGDFDRISRFDTQSHCVNSDTDEDKKMKELCMCK